MKYKPRANRILRGWVGTTAAVAVSLFVLLTGFVPAEIDEPVRILVDRGEDVFAIGRKLDKNDVIVSRFTFWLLSFGSGRAGRLKAGEYEFSGRVSVWDALTAITEGRTIGSEKSIFIPEGFTLRDTEARLVEAGLISDGALQSLTPRTLASAYSFLRGAPSAKASTEGFWFPDTYRFEVGSSEEEIVEKFLSNFDRKTAVIRHETIRQGKDFYDVLTIASILEKEVPPRDMRRAAGVLEKRLASGMPLQVDATLVYALGRPIRRDDIDTLKSPYNSYQHTGLPPTPISNPGLTALEAALNPENNDFWFYLSRSDTGETIFSRTFEEHNAARLLYIR